MSHRKADVLEHCACIWHHIQLRNIAECDNSLSTHLTIDTMFFKDRSNLMIIYNRVIYITDQRQLLSTKNIKANFMVIKYTYLVVTVDEMHRTYLMYGKTLFKLLFKLLL